MISGMYSALSGLLGFSRKVETTANNVANVNTPGFKASKVSLAGGGAQSVATAAGSSQVGRGVTVGSIDRNQAQGMFASSENPTDLAIGGQGFFLLRAPESSTADTFTRTGGFTFNKEGDLVNANGYFAQGWTIADTGEKQGSIGDINIGKTTPPVATESIKMVVNIDARQPEETTNINLFDAWDGRNAAASPPTSPIDPTNFDYSSSIKAYDSQGAAHDINIYFDKTAINNQWEFMVTTNPLEDHRQLTSAQQAAFPPFSQYDAASHKGAGALMYGTINFNSAGQINSIEAFNVPPDGAVDPSSSSNKISINSADTNYSFAANFTGDATNQNIELNLGAIYSGQGNNFSPESLATTQYANNSTTIFQNQDGLAAGFLQGISVGTDGVISGRYSNGQIIKKAQVALANFNNPNGLVAMGNNLFSAGSASGAAIPGTPGSGGLGTIAPNTVEQSNVDLGQELPSLMLSKRYFQANLKIIQTEDEMLGNLLDIKE